MPVTIHPPITTIDATPIDEPRGADWKTGAMGSLQVVDESAVVVAEFAAGQWGWVEHS
jgi:hypothetical protein